MQAIISRKDFRKLAVLPACAASFEGDRGGFTGICLKFTQKSLVGYSTNAVLLARREVSLASCDIPVSIWVKASDLSQAIKSLDGMETIGIGLDGSQLAFVQGEKIYTAKILIPATFDFEIVLRHWSTFSEDVEVSRKDLLGSLANGTERRATIVIGGKFYDVDRKLLTRCVRSIQERRIVLEGDEPDRAIRISAPGLAILMMPMKSDGGAR